MLIKINLSFSDYLLLISGILSIYLGLVTYIKNPKDHTNKSFLLIVIVLVCWIYGSFFIDSSPRYDTALFWSKFLFITTAFMPSTFYYFAVSFPNQTLNQNKNKTILLIFISIIFSIISFTDLIVADIDQSVYPVKVIHGQAYFGFFIFTIITLLWGVYKLIMSYKKSHGIDRQKFRFFIGGIVALVIFALTTNVILPTFGITFFVRIGPIFSLIFVGTTTYSILKYRLLDIRLAIRQNAIKFLFIIPLGFFYSIIIFLLEKINPNFPISSTIIITFIIAAISVYIYEPTLKILQRFFSNFIFRKEYNREELIRKLGKNIQESIDLHNLINIINRALKEILEAEFTNIHFASSPNQIFTPQIWDYFQNKSEIVVKDEIKITLQSLKTKSHKKEIMKEIVKEMETKGIQIAAPLKGQKEIIGFIILGEKKYNEAYTINDIEILDTIRYQAGIAIENANLYDEVKSFSQKLKNEIKAATHDLSQKNKFLTVLRKLDYIIMNTLDINDICQKIVDLVSWELGYSGAIIALIDQDKKILRTYAISNTPTFNKLNSILPKNLNNLYIPLNNNDSLAIKALNERKILQSDTMIDIYSPVLPKEIIKQIEKITGISKHLICPLSAKGKSLGVIVVGIQENEISLQEKDIVTAFIEETGIAIENAMLYSSLNEMNKKLVRANKELQELDIMKDEFVSVASHELRTPMTAIRGYAWMLEKSKHSQTLNDKQKEYLTKITASTDRLISLVNDILDVSRIESGRIQMNIEADDISNLIEESISEINPRALSKNQILYYDKPQKALPKVLMDRKRIYEVLVNLIGNAIKFTPEAGKIVIHTRQKGNMIQVSIKDTGRGIEKKDIPKLFKKFGRLEHSFALISETQGTGLGLYITKKYINLHGGKIWATSEIEKGSTFNFTLRQAKTTNNAIEQLPIPTNN